MALEIEDGFNFAMGEWLAEVTRMVIGGAVITLIFGLIYGGACLYDWYYERKERK